MPSHGRGTSERVHRYNHISLFPETCGSSWLARPAVLISRTSIVHVLLAPPPTRPQVSRLKCPFTTARMSLGRNVSLYSLNLGQSETRENNAKPNEKCDAYFHPFWWIRNLDFFLCHTLKFRSPNYYAPSMKVDPLPVLEIIIASVLFNWKSYKNAHFHSESLFFLWIQIEILIIASFGTMQQPWKWS